MARQSTKPALAVIQAELADPDYKVRKEAIKQLMRYYRKQAYEPLLDMLGDARGDVRAKAVEALGMLKDARAVMPVLGLLTDKNTSVRAKTARALGNFGDLSVVRPLIDLLNDPKPQIRAYAARSLGQLRASNALPAVQAYFERTKNTTDIDGMELYHAAFALGSFDVPGAIEPILALYQPSAQENPLLAPNYWLVAEILSKQGEHMRPILLEILTDQARPAGLRACVTEALAKKPQPQYMQPLVTALSDDYSFVCVNAAEALGKLRDSRAIEPLARLLDDPRENVVSAAIEALSALHATSVADRLVELLSMSSSTRLGSYKVLQAVIKALGLLGEAQAVQPLLAVFQQPLPFECLSEIATALRKLNDPTIVEPLLQNLLLFKERQQWYTFQILEHFRDPRAVEPLLRLLALHDPQTTLWHEITHQERIIRLLAILGDARAVEPLRVYARRTTNKLHFAAMSALETLGAPMLQ